MAGITSRLAGGGLDLVGLVRVGSLGGLLGGGDGLDLGGGGGLLLGAGLLAAALLGVDQPLQGLGLGVEDLLGGLEETPLRGLHLGVEAVQAIAGVGVLLHPQREPQVAPDELGQVDGVEGALLRRAEAVDGPGREDRDLRGAELEGSSLRESTEQEVVDLLVLVAAVQVGLPVLAEPLVQVTDVVGPVALELPVALERALGRDGEVDGAPRGVDAAAGEDVHGLDEVARQSAALHEGLDRLHELAGCRRQDGLLLRLGGGLLLVGVVEGGGEDEGAGGHYDSGLYARWRTGGWALR